ncbi:hypothetical protein OHW22_11535 [Acinetobacter baumannii]|nr:hypothetical protein [Acinetobacter baumannii]
MDRKQFEEWFKTTLSYAIFEDSNVWKVDLYAFNEPTNSYLHLGVQAAFESYHHQQAKVDELKATIKGNHGRIAELERLNRVKAQAIIDLHQEITELKASHHGEVIGHEVHLKKIKQERDELQKRVDACQKLLNELKDAKAELVECDLYDKGVRCALYSVIQDLEQALKGGEA